MEILFSFDNTNLRTKEKNNNIILEAFLYQSLLFWHAHFGFPRASNNLNILNCCFLVDLLQGVGFIVAFVVNGNKCFWYYLLVDGIYPCQSILCNLFMNLRWKKFTLLSLNNLVGRGVLHLFVFTLLWILFNNGIVT